MADGEYDPDRGVVVRQDDGDEDDGDEHPRRSGSPDRRESEEQDVFRGIYGHHGAREVVAAALRQGDTHVLFEGPPGSGKSAFLLALESNVPGVMYRDGDQITAAKLRDVLKSDPPILLIDEIDALDNEAYDVLSTPMEHGRLVRDSARESYDVSVGTQIVAACNHASELPEHIHNRFRTLTFEPYSEEEYVNVCEKMLLTEVDWVDDPEDARQIAETVKEVIGRADPREARDTARMAGSMEEVENLAKALHDPDADIDAGPLHPSEVKRAQGEVGKEQLREVLAREMVNSGGGPEAADPTPEEPDDPASNPGSEADKQGSGDSASADSPERSSKARPGVGEAAEEAVENEIEGAVEDAVM